MTSTVEGGVESSLLIRGQDVVNVLRKNDDVRTGEDLQLLFDFLTTTQPELYSNLSPLSSERRNAMYDICRHVRLRIAQANETICRQTEAGADFFIILKGRVKVFFNLALTGTSTDDSHKLDDENFELGSELAILEPGQAFGELALDPNSDGRRRASIVVAPFDDDNKFEYCELLYIDKTTYNRCVRAHVDNSSALSSRLEMFQEMYIFQDWSRAALFSIGYSMKELTLTKQEQIFLADDRADAIYIVVTGRIRMNRMMLVGGKYRPVEVEVVGRLGLCGYPEMINGNRVPRRTESATCITPTCTLLVISSETYRSLLRLGAVAGTEDRLFAMAKQREEWLVQRHDFVAATPHLHVSLTPHMQAASLLCHRCGLKGHLASAASMCRRATNDAKRRRASLSFMLQKYEEPPKAQQQPGLDSSTGDPTRRRKSWGGGGGGAPSTSSGGSAAAGGGGGSGAGHVAVAKNPPVARGGYTGGRRRSQSTSSTAVSQADTNKEISPPSRVSGGSEHASPTVVDESGVVKPPPATSQRRRSGSYHLPALGRPAVPGSTGGNISHDHKEKDNENENEKKPLDPSPPPSTQRRRGSGYTIQGPYPAEETKEPSGKGAGIFARMFEEWAAETQQKVSKGMSTTNNNGDTGLETGAGRSEELGNGGVKQSGRGGGGSARPPPGKPGGPRRPPSPRIRSAAAGSSKQEAIIGGKEHKPQSNTSGKKARRQSYGGAGDLSTAAAAIPSVAMSVRRRRSLAYVTAVQNAQTPSLGAMLAASSGPLTPTVPPALTKQSVRGKREKSRGGKIENESWDEKGVARQA